MLYRANPSADPLARLETLSSSLAGSQISISYHGLVAGSEEIQ